MTNLEIERCMDSETNPGGDGAQSEAPAPIPRRLRRLDPPEGAAAEVEEGEIAGLQGPLVIVGDPGAGKSVLMEALDKTQGAVFVRAARLVRMANPSKILGSPERLIIDGVDEVASNAPGGGVEAVLTKLSELDYPDFIISCRAADWRGAADRVKIKDDYAREATMLALQPFDRKNAAQFLQTRFSTLDADRVLDHLINRGLHDIYGNPLTLRLLGEVALDGGVLPGSRGELLAKACPKLVLEANDRHKDRSHAGRVPEELMLSAGASAAAFLLCDKLGLFTGAAAEQPAAFVSLANISSLPFSEALEDAAKTRLFKAEGENLLVPVHRVVAEYLAAKWLARCVSSGQSARRVIGLLRQGGAVPTSLRAVNAWLAGFSPELAARCVADDPYGVLRYGDTDILPDQTARALLRALTALSHEDPYFRAEDWSGLSARGLARSALKDDLIALLQSPGEHQVLGALLIEAMQGTELGTTLAVELRKILEDPARAYLQRANALDILTERGAISDWNALCKTLSDHGDDSSLRIAANAALRTAIDQISPAQAVPILLGHVGLTRSLADRQSRPLINHSLRPTARLLAQSAAMLDQWLDTLADYGAMVMKENNHRRTALVDFALALLAKRLTHDPAPLPEQLGHWVVWLRGQRGYERKAPEAIRKFLTENVALRRQVLAELFLRGNANDLLKTTVRVGDQSLGLYPDHEDCAELLRVWHAKEAVRGPDNDMWETLLWMGRSRDGLSEPLRTAAQETSRKDPVRLESIAKLARPIETQLDPEDAALEAVQAAEREANFAWLRKDLSKNLLLVDEGGAILQQVAHAYRGRFHEVNELSENVHERMDDFLTPPLAQRVLEGFVASLARTDLPTPLEIAQAHAEKKEYPIEVVLLAGVSEMLRAGRPLAVLPRDNLESVYMAWRRDPDSNTDDPIGIEDGLAEIVLDTPQAQERFYRTSIEPQLEAKVEHIDDFYRLSNSTSLNELAGRLSREWLLRFPLLSARIMSELLPSALVGEHADIRQFVIDSRNQPCVDHDALFMWLGLDFIADFADREADLRRAGTDNRDFLWIVRSIVNPPTGSRLAPLAEEQLGFIVNVFAPSWPYLDRPRGVTRGDDNGWDATNFIKECIATLAAMPTDKAAAGLRALLETVDAGYKNELKHAIAQQRRVQADHDYAPAELGALRAAVSNHLPQTVDDLRAFLADRLSVLRAKLAGDNIDSWSIYWDRDRPHDENACRNRLIGQISRELPEAIMFGPEEQMPGITRADIGVRLNKLVLPTEIKGQWHPEVWVAASAQLDAQYMRDWRAEGCGVYIVLWFGDVPGHNLPPHPDGSTLPATPKELRNMLIERIPEDRRSSIDVYVLDASGTVEGRGRLAVGRVRKRRKARDK